MDKDFVKLIESELNGCNHETWLDEKKLEPGDELELSLSAAIKRAKSVLLFLSKASLRSKWVRYEFEFWRKCHAEGQKKALIPCVLGEVTDSELCDAGFGNIVFVDFRQVAQYENQMQRLLNAISDGDSITRLPALDGERSDRYMLVCQTEVMRTWVIKFLKDTMAARPDESERYWSYITLATVGSSNLIPYFKHAISTEKPFARRGAQEAIDLLCAQK